MPIDRKKRKLERVIEFRELLPERPVQAASPVPCKTCEQNKPAPPPVQKVKAQSMRESVQAIISKVQTGLGYAKSLSKWSAGWLAGGFKVTTEPQYAERIGGCLVCPSGLLDHTKMQCGACGCFVEYKAAGIVQEENKSDCPRGHWPIIQTGSKS